MIERTVQIRKRKIKELSNLSSDLPDILRHIFARIWFDFHYILQWDVYILLFSIYFLLGNS
jgi:hypothetical protein